MSSHLPPSVLLTRLRLEGYRTTKRLGQHFLSDEALLERIANLTGANSETLVIEIGPGPATLTAYLAERAKKVIAIERDERLRDFHAEVFPASSNVQFIYADALRVDLWELAREESAAIGASRRVLAGNIPFQITSPLLFGQIGPGQPWDRLVLMIQKEVADRITAKPHTRDYGILTVKLAFWWRVAERIEVPSAMFMPPPQVDAAVLLFEPADTQNQDVEKNWPRFSKFIDLCFNQRRKKLYNSPAASSISGREGFRKALEASGLNPDVRAEDLAPDDFLKLFLNLQSQSS